MNIIRKGAVALAAVAALGTGAGLAVAAQSASASGVSAFAATAQLTSARVIAPNVDAYTFNEYIPSVVAPGYRLYATLSELCVVGARGAACNWRLTQANLPRAELTGNALIGGKGQVGNITGGTGPWLGARGIFRGINLVPGVQTDTFVFSTP